LINNLKNYKLKIQIHRAKKWKIICYNKINQSNKYFNYNNYNNKIIKNYFNENFEIILTIIKKKFLNVENKYCFINIKLEQLTLIMQIL